MNKTARLVIPMDQTLHSALQERATALGFDSSQALLRYVSKAVVDERRIDFGQGGWGEPSQAAADRLNRWAKEAKRDSQAGKLKSFNTTEEFMRDLRA